LLDARRRRAPTLNARSGRVELTVILSCRNGARTIGRQLEALAGQSWGRPWEVVVSDNGSTDESLAIVERYRGRLPSLRIVDASQKVGLPHSRNVGAAAAEGRALAFCDVDDEVGGGWVAAMGEALRRDELVAGRLEHERLNEQWAIEVRGNPQVDGLPDWSFVPYWPFAFGCTIGITRRLHDSVGGFDEDMVPSGEDLDYCWRLQLSGERIRFVHGAVTHYQLRHRLREIYRQARNYGVGNALVYKKHRALGMPRPPHPFATGVVKWLGLVKLFAFAWSRKRLALAVWHLGLRTGMLEGSVRHRVLLL
jgi:glycosyltransferase involved in cell wall biosynthesis